MPGSPRTTNTLPRPFLVAEQSLEGFTLSLPAEQTRGRQRRDHALSTIRRAIRFTTS
jgi:hypothetical protein